MQGGVAGLLAGFLHSLVEGFGHHEVIGSRSVIIGRDAMSPPQLARDAPVVDVFHPVAVGVLELFGDKAAHDGFQGWFGQMLHLEEPLQRDFRLDHRFGAFGGAHLVGVGFHFFQQTFFGQFLFDGLAHCETVHALVVQPVLVEGSVVVEDVDDFQTVFVAQHLVVDIVRRGSLQAAGTEFDVHVFVFDHRDAASDDGHDDAFAVKVPVAWVVRVDAHGRIAEDGFGTGGGHYDIVIGTFHVVTQVVQFALLFDIDHFFVRDGGEGFRVPVDHAVSAVDEPLVVQVDEYVRNGAGQVLVHGELGAVPVAGGAQFLELLEDDTPVLAGPIPGVFQELFAREVGFLDPLFLQAGHHFGFRSDRGVVHARYPAGVVAFHSGAAHQKILDGVVHHVAHVKHPGDVRRGNDDGVGFTRRVDFRVEVTALHPVIVPFVLQVFRVVLRRYVHVFSGLFALCRCEN